MTIEEWRDIPNYDGYYQVSDSGRVRSVERVIPNGYRGAYRAMPSRVLKPYPASTPDKRPIVSLSKNGHVRKYGVHILVALSFIGPKPHGKSQCCHEDGNPHNNKPQNLYWGDNSTNVRDTIRHGRFYQSNKTECPYGHALEAPNLRMRFLSQYGRRACRACAIAYTWANRRGITDVADPMRRAYADRKYQELMSCPG